MTSPLASTAEAVHPGAYPWVVYVLTDEAQRHFSISMAKDAGARALRHRICGNLKRQTPLLVLTEAFADRHTAVTRMLRLRRWHETELRKLIDEANPDWRDLAEEE
ncbi:MAG: hypothetical protein AAF830_06005 [Pseudomonadota bacterium]